MMTIGTTFKHTSSTALLMSCLASAGFTATAQAADYPERPIRIVVPYSAGGGTDNIARLLAEKLGARLPQPVLVENKGGAGGNIGADLVAKSEPDGYTLLLGGMGPMAVNPTIFAKMPYDPAKDFVPIAKLASAPFVLVAGLSAPFDNVGQLIEYAKSNPGKLVAGTAGDGSPEHLCAGLFANAAGIKLLNVPYRGSAPAITDLLGGTVNIMCENVGTIGPFIQSQKVRPLAVSTASRSRKFPEVPTFAEAGVAGVEFSPWFMLVAPAGTPEPIVQKLNAAAAEVLKMPEVIARIEELGNEPAGGTVDEARAFLRDENARWLPISKAIGLAKQ